METGARQTHVMHESDVEHVDVLMRGHGCCHVAQLVRSKSS